jgi:flagellin-like hook-associated protein FlgL
MIIQHNMTASNTSRMLDITGGKIAKSSEKLSSGYRINRAGDDAAGLSISEKMRGQIRGLEQSSSNAQDGISFIQTAEGATNEVHALLQRGRELSVQAANDTNASEDRDAIQKEINAIIQEVDRIGNDTEFNTIKCFSLDGAAAGSADTQSVSKYKVSLVDAFQTGGSTESSTGSTSTGSATNYTGATATLASTVEKYSENAASQILSKFSGLSAKASQNSVGLNLANMDGVNGTLASAEVGLTSSIAGTDIEYKLNIDTSDYKPSGYDADKLASTVAHEMMHIVMDDTLTTGMLSKTDRFPKWFVEGAAQTMGGGFTAGHNTGVASMSNSQLSSYLSDFKTDVYGAGYLATMYLGAAADAGSSATSITAVNSSDIASGLDTIFTAVANGDTLDKAIADNTKYSGLKDFQDHFAVDATTFAHNLATAVGAGAGSLLTTNLSDKSSVLAGSFTNAAVSTPDATHMFNIATNSTSYTNHYAGIYNGTSGGGGGMPADTTALHVQVGANAEQSITFNRFNISSAALGIDQVGVMDHTTAGNAIDSFDGALKAVSNVRSYYGAIQNRLEHSISNIDNTAENLQAAESRIRDVNIADEMVKFSKNNILQQAAQSMLAQANQSTQGILSVIQ